MSTHTKHIPHCVGFIMDGNRRWAKERGIETHLGHARGYVALQKIIAAAGELMIPHVVCYAFSTENWSRSETEVSYVMNLMLTALKNDTDNPATRIRFIGERTGLSTELITAMETVERKAKPSATVTLWIAFNYGGRAEIVSAANRAIEQGVAVTEQTFGQLLWTRDMPDPDLIIRTSGEMRLSNFLPWQSAYSELFFTETLWPDFGELEFKRIVEAYGKRERRRGK